MRAVALVARSDLRRRWIGTIAVAVLAGIIGALVLSTLAGARRSDSALRRFNEFSRSADMEVTAGNASPAQLAAFEHTPGIAATGLIRGYALLPANPALQNLPIGAAVDTRSFNVTIDRPRLVAGRVANPAAADEVDIDEPLAKVGHLRIGDTLALNSWTPRLVTRMLATNVFEPPNGPRIRLRIVGLIRRPLDLGERGGVGGVMVLQPAFNTAYGRRIGTFNGYILRVRADRAADVPELNARAHQIFGRQPGFQLQGLSIDKTGANDAIHVLALALLVFAGVAALAGLVALAVTLDRELASSRHEQEALLALGLSRPQRFTITGVRVLLVAVVGGVLAVAGAIAVSPLFPFGVARRADPDPGLHADWFVLGLGFAAVVLGVCAIGVVAALRATRVAKVERTAGTVGYATRAVEATAGAGVPASVTTGLRLALEPGRGDRAVPLRSAFVAGAFAVAGVTAVAVFAASLSQLASTPSLYGDRFQFKVETSTAEVCNRADNGVGEVPGVGSLDAYCYENVQLDGRSNVGFADEPLRGSIGPEVVDGTAPSTKTEVALGASTLATLHKHIGGTVSVSGPGGHGTFRIVGQVVFPVLGDPQPVADGAWFAQPGLDALTGPPGTPGAQDFSRYLVGSYTPGADRAAVDARIARLVRNPGAFPSAGVSGPELPVEVSRLRQTNWFPIALAGLLGFLGLVAIGHTLVVGTRRRRRDLAILKTLGFERRQIRYAIAWEASLFAFASLVVGIPVGLALGAIVWRSVADGVGVSNTPAIPIGIGLGALVVAAFVLVNAVAFLPARSASRRRPALALRSE
jgi:hypothetical protein